MRRRFKGQYMSFDAIIGSLIFMTIFLLIISYWQTFYNTDKVLTNLLQQDAIRVTSLILSNDPSYGILDKEGICDPDKISYINVEDLSAYNIYVKLWSTTTSDTHSAGSLPPQDSVRVISHVSRIVKCNNGDDYILDVFIYK